MKPSDVCFNVVPRCRFLLICTLVSTTVNPFSDTILETLKRVQARNVFQSCSASLSPNPRDEQQTPSAEIPVVQDHMALISVENMTLVSPIILAIFTLSQTHTHTHTHCVLLLIQSLSLPNALLEEFDLTWESMNSSTQQNVTLPQSTGSRLKSVL